MYMSVCMYVYEKGRGRGYSSIMLSPPPPPSLVLLPKTHTHTPICAFEHSFTYIILYLSRSTSSYKQLDNSRVTTTGSENKRSPTILMKIQQLRKIRYDIRYDCQQHIVKYYTLSYTNIILSHTISKYTINHIKSYQIIS